MNVELCILPTLFGGEPHLLAFTTIITRRLYIRLELSSDRVKRTSFNRGKMKPWQKADRETITLWGAPPQFHHAQGSVHIVVHCATRFTPL